MRLQGAAQPLFVTAHEHRQPPQFPTEGARIRHVRLYCPAYGGYVQVLQCVDTVGGEQGHERPTPLVAQPLMNREAEALFQQNERDARINPRELFSRLQAAVCAAVVDEHELDVITLCQKACDLAEPAHELRQRPFFVRDGQHDADERARLGRRGKAALAGARASTCICF